MIYEDLKGKKVLVTGSSSGIGQATATMFSKQGCFVGVHYFQTKKGGDKVFWPVEKFQLDTDEKNTKRLTERHHK